MEKLLLSPEEVAEVLGVSRVYVYTLLNRECDPIPSFLLGKCRKVRTKELEMWVERQCTSKAGEAHR